MMDKHTMSDIEKIVGPLTASQREEIRQTVASYGLACVMDSAVRTEAETICEKK